MSLLIVLCMLVNTPESKKGPDEKVRAELEHIKVSYEANRAAFPHGTFRFDYLRGSADNEESARNGRLRPTPIGKGFYAFDGTNARYDILYEPRELASAIVRKSAADRGFSTLFAIRLLTDGEATLVDQLWPDEKGEELIHDGQIFEKDMYLSSFEFPIALGNPDDLRTGIGRLIKRCLDGVVELQSYEPHQTFEGRDVALIVFKMKEGARSFWIDLERGSIPIQVEDRYEGKTEVSRYNLDDVRFENGAGWLPRVMTTSLQGGKVVSRVVLREITLDPPPGRSVFQLDFPKEFRLYDRVRERTYNSRKVWSLLDLPSPNSPESQVVQNQGYVPPAPVLPGERPTPFWTRWTIGLAAVGVVCLGAAGYFKFRNHSARPS